MPTGMGNTRLAPVTRSVMSRSKTISVNVVWNMRLNVIIYRLPKRLNLGHHALFGSFTSLVSFPRRTIQYSLRSASDLFPSDLWRHPDPLPLSMRLRNVCDILRPVCRHIPATSIMPAPCNSSTLDAAHGHASRHHVISPYLPGQVPAWLPSSETTGAVPCHPIYESTWEPAKNLRRDGLPEFIDQYCFPATGIEVAQTESSC